MSQQRKLLFIAPRFLFPADSGGKIRTRDVLRGMKGQAFHITLVSPEPEDNQDHASELDRVCDRLITWPQDQAGLPYPLKRVAGLLSSKPVSVAMDRSPSARRVVAAELGGDYDLVIIDFPHSAEFLTRPVTKPVLIFTHNVEAEIYLRHAKLAGFPMSVIWRDQYRKMLRYERDVLASCDSVIAVSQRDRQFFESEFGHPHVSDIPTGVDLEEFPYKPPASVPRDDSRMSLVFVGSMDWRANIDAIAWFMDDVWPIVAAKRDDIAVTIVGRSPPPSLVSQAKDRNLPWSFTGFVDDLRPYVYESIVYIMPLRIGGGTRIKSFQGMALGCPVVSTTLGVEGLPLTPGQHYLLADSAEDFAAAILRIAEDEAVRNELSLSAYHFVRENFSSAGVAREFERICLETVARTGN